MRTMKFLVLFLCLAATLVLSCKTQPTIPSYYAPGLVDPQVTEVAPDGKLVKVNIGMLDKVHVGQRLYVLRSNQLVGMLTVTKPTSYTSECAIVASKNTNKPPPDTKVALGNIRVGDRVARELKYVPRAGFPGDRVPYLVPIPYEPDNASLKGGAKEIVIPRDLVEQWRREHPPAQTPPSK